MLRIILAKLTQRIRRIAVIDQWLAKKELILWKNSLSIGHICECYYNDRLVSGRLLYKHPGLNKHLFIPDNPKEHPKYVNKSDLLPPRKQ